MWISLTEASRILGVHRGKAAQDCHLGNVKVMAKPGSNLQYWRADVEKLARKRIQPSLVEAS
jgi:predicted site-specific integrase-resolvase